jgi:MerR family transcriptional regulator, light-induced transcriptional regulator
LFNLFTTFVKQNRMTMNNVKNVFSIKDLENLSGIKAGTIRIWEKRYNLLEPMRTDTNIRFYDLAALQKLLNVTLLHDHGYKISKISEYPSEQIPVLVRDIITDKSVNHHAISEFKMAMMHFDQSLFFKTYNDLLSEKSFREVFHQVFIPLMNEIGLLWQSDTISPAHEHFITYLIKQKILINTEKLQYKTPKNDSRVFVLYLPVNEIHELGLMYLNYEILRHGFKTIYLGESVPIDSLLDVKKYFDNITFLSYLTVEPNQDEVNAYVKRLNQEILNDETSEVWLIGRMVKFVETKNISEKTSVFESIIDLVHYL